MTSSPAERLLLLALLLLACGCQGLGRPAFSHPLTLRRDGLEVVVESGPRDAERDRARAVAAEVLAEYEGLRAEVADSPLAPLLTQGGPEVEVFVFRDRESFLSFAPDVDNRSVLAGYYYDVGRRAYLPALPDDDLGAPWLVLRHELGHHLHLSAHRRASAWWLNEGLAHYLEQGLEVSKPDFVRLLPTVAEQLESGDATALARLKTLADARDGEPDAFLQRLYSWLLVRALLVLDETREPFIAWLLDDASDPNDIAQLAQALGLTPPQLARRFRLASLRVCEGATHDAWLAQLGALRANLESRRRRFLAHLLTVEPQLRDSPRPANTQLNRETPLESVFLAAHGFESALAALDAHRRARRPKLWPPAPEERRLPDSP